MKRKLFESFIKDCVDRKIKLFVVKSPTYVKQIGTDPYVAEAKKITAQYNIPFWDYSNDPDFIVDNGKYFGDRSHMNNTGAQLFTTTLVERIISSGK